MKNFKRIVSVILVLSTIISLFGCSKPSDKPNIVTLNAEVAINNAIVMITSEKGIFKDSISPKDLEFYVRYPGDKEKTKIEPENVMYQTPEKIGTNFMLNDDVMTIELLVKKTGTLNGKEYIGAAEKIIYTSGAGEEEIQKGVEAIKKMLTKGTFSTAMGYGMTAISGCMSVYDVLQVLGYAKNKQYTAIEKILNNVKVIEDSVDSLDKKLDTVYGNLKAELNKINVTTKRTLRNTYAQQWSDFKTQYIDTNSGLCQQINAFINKYSANFCSYPADKTGTFNIYYDENGNPAVPVSQNMEPMISVDGNNIDKSQTISIKIDKNTFNKSKSMTVKAIDDERFTNVFTAELKTALLTNPNVTEGNIDKVIDDAMAVIATEVMIDTLNERGKNGTVADDLIDSYTLFCNKLCDHASNPVDAYHYLITSNYNFQSEAKDDIIAFNDYILALAAEGRMYCDMAAMFGSVSNAKKSLIDVNANKAAAFMESHTGLREEKEGTQYCYVTDSYVTANQYSASLYENITCHLGVMVFYTTGCYDSSEYRLEWNNEPNNIIATSDLQEIYATFRAMYACGATQYTNFEDYFLAMLALPSKDRSSFNLSAMGMISGSTFAKRSFSLDGTTKLKAYSDVFSAATNKKAAVHAPCEYFETGKTYALGTEFKSSDADKGCFKEHSAIYSDVMDIKTEQFYTDKQLISGAMYIEASGTFIVDELWEFAGIADLSNKDNWSSIVTGSRGDPTYDPQHPYGDYRDWLINNDTHAAEPLDYSLNAGATFWAIVNYR